MRFYTGFLGFCQSEVVMRTLRTDVLRLQLVFAHLQVSSSTLRTDVLHLQVGVAQLQVSSSPLRTDVLRVQVGVCTVADEQFPVAHGRFARAGRCWHQRR